MIDKFVHRIKMLSGYSLFLCVSLCLCVSALKGIDEDGWYWLEEFAIGEDIIRLVRAV